MNSDLYSGICLSIRQPWAWLIVSGWKNIENRTWSTNVRGQILIHASNGMTRSEYDACSLFMMAQGMGSIQLPAYERLERGGIVGSAVILDCVTSHSSEWFTGPYGFVLGDAMRLEFLPCNGRLGFFTATKQNRCVSNSKGGDCPVDLGDGQITGGVPFDKTSEVPRGESARAVTKVERNSPVAGTPATTTCHHKCVGTK